jgi:two-component system NarL family sensor kinase
VGLLLACLAFSYLLYNRSKIKQQAILQQTVMRQQKLAMEAVIEAEEKKRKRIARDLHNGVGQMMSAAQMNLSLLEKHINFYSSEKAVALVDESCREVRSVSHNMMPNALIKTGLASAVRAFIEQIETPYLKVQVYTESLNETINKNTETVLYRVLQARVNNVVKHSGGTNLDIALIKDESGINTTIEDKGKGFNTNDKNKFTGIGLDNIQKRIDFLKGTIEWQSSPGAGTLVAVYVTSLT